MNIYYVKRVEPIGQIKNKIRVTDTDVSFIS